MLSVALGNVAHLVYMIANFLELPLRYPVLVKGSRSSVIDVVTDKLADKEREYVIVIGYRKLYRFRLLSLVHTLIYQQLFFLVRKSFVQNVLIY